MSDRRSILSVELSPEEMLAFDAARGSRSRSEVVRSLLRAYADLEPEDEARPVPVPQSPREESKPRRFRRMRSMLSAPEPAGSSHGKPAQQVTQIMRESMNPVPGKPVKPATPSRRFAHEEIAASGDMSVMVQENDGSWSYVNPPEKPVYRDRRTGAFGENQPSDVKHGGSPPVPKVGERFDTPIDNTVVQVQHDPDHHLSRSRNPRAAADEVAQFRHDFNTALGRE